MSSETSRSSRDRERSEIEIRFAEPDDLDSIVRIYNQAIRAGERTGDLTEITVDERRKAALPSSLAAYVALTDGRVAGYLTLVPYRPGKAALRHTAEVSYFVDFSYHRRGIGAALLDRAAAAAPELGITTLVAIVIDTNDASVGLLESRGFGRWGHLPRVAEFDGTEVGHLYYGLRIPADRAT